MVCLFGSNRFFKAVEDVASVFFGDAHCSKFCCARLGAERRGGHEPIPRGSRKTIPRPCDSCQCTRSVRPYDRRYRKHVYDTNRVALLGNGALEQTQLQLGQVLVDRCRQMGERSQFLNTWTVGDPSLAFGLYRPGD